jgi:hypothetical protein
MFRQVEAVAFPPAITKVVLQDGRVTGGWDSVDTRRPYCVLEARSVLADRSTLVEAGSAHEVEFVDHKWIDLPYGAAYATSMQFKTGELKTVTCLKPSVYADDYMTWDEFVEAAGGILRYGPAGATE